MRAEVNRKWSEKFDFISILCFSKVNWCLIVAIECIRALLNTNSEQTHQKLHRIPLVHVSRKVSLLRRPFRTIRIARSRARRMSEFQRGSFSVCVFCVPFLSPVRKTNHLAPRIWKTHMPSIITDWIPEKKQKHKKNNKNCYTSFGSAEAHYDYFAVFFDFFRVRLWLWVSRMRAYRVIAM